MPITGGRWRKLWKLTAVIIVSRNSAMMRRAPTFSWTVSVASSGCVLGTAKCMIAAGTRKLTAEGRNREKNSWNWTIPFCQTIRVVMSPKGLKAPPAFAATTILIQARLINFTLLPPTAMTTAHSSRAVVRLSATGEIKKARMPVIQKSCLNEKSLLTSHERSEAKTLRSSMALI